MSIQTSSVAAFISTAAKRNLTVIKQEGQLEDPLTHYYAYTYCLTQLFGYCAEEGDYAPGEFAETKQESRQMEADISHPRF